MSDEAGRQRVVIEGVEPEIDGGRFPIKRVVGERVAVEADIYADGPDVLSCRLLYRGPEAAAWSQAPLEPLGNDRWRGELTVTGPGRWRYTVTGWVDPFKTWRRDLARRVEAGQDVAADLLAGAVLVRQTSRRAEEAGRRADARVLAGLAANLETEGDPKARLQLALDAELAALMERLADRRFASYHRELGVVVDRERARFSSWYETFPRSAGAAGADGRHGTLQDAEAQLPAIAATGFDVVSLPPVPPGPETDGEVGHLLGKAGEHGVEIALGLDVQRFDFASEGWRSLWQEIKGAVDRWVALGVRIFRVNDPQEQPFPFWEWLLTEVKREHPDVLFLAVALTRPKLEVRLAKLGFTWSASHLPWNDLQRGLPGFVTETAAGKLRETFRPCLWPAAPDLRGGPAFSQWLILTATLWASYGIQGPAFERMAGAQSEEEPGSGTERLSELIALVNRIRRENPALQSDRGLRFHPANNPQILCYSKVDDTGTNVILVVVNLDPHHAQSTWLDLDGEALGIPRDQPYQVHDLLTKARYLWHGLRNFVQLDPQAIPAHIFRVRRGGGSSDRRAR